LVSGAEVQYTCNDSGSDIGNPACCSDVTTPPGTHIGIPLPCQAISTGY